MLNWRPAGVRGALVECGDVVTVQTVYAAVRTALKGAHQAQHPGLLEDCVPAAETLLMLGRHAHYWAAWACEQSLQLQRSEAGASVEIPVRYEGEDLGAVAEFAGLSIGAVIDAHQSAHWQVAFCGFAPGFAYLTGGPTVLQVPRRASPRKQVPAGSVALAGEYTGIYPRPSPGGWQLIGRTEVSLWDLQREIPALLQPGMQVRFRVLP